MTQALLQSSNDQPISDLELDLTFSEQLADKVTSARQAMERAVGYQLEIERFEHIEVAGEGVLRVFWRKAVAE